MTSASEVVAEWQHPSAGDDIRLHPDVALQVAVATRRPGVRQSAWMKGTSSSSTKRS